jgi:hypothetical protein
VTKRPRPAKYHRDQLGGGNTLRAVTRTKRAAAGHQLGKAPGKAAGPANWRVHRRRAAERAMAVIEQAQEREASGGQDQSAGSEVA